MEKDPKLETIGIGTKALFNGAVGFITGVGTRSSQEKPNLSGYAELKVMRPRYVGGFNTSAGPDVFCSWVIPIPITNPGVLESAKRTDDEIPLPIVDVNDRKAIGYARYGDVWKKGLTPVRYLRDACASCERCYVLDRCPTGAFELSKGINQSECVNCGACLVACPGSAFEGELGSITLNGTQIPVTLRQSDRYNADRLIRTLKRQIERGEFLLSAPVKKIVPNDRLA